MKKILLLILALLMCVPALAEDSTTTSKVIRIADESELPEGWADKDLLRITVLDMQRSDSILLQCGGENMLVDGGLGNHYLRLFRVLDDRNITSFKYLLSTHCDGDHSQGLKCLINSDLYGTSDLLCPNPKDYDDPDDDHEKMVRAADNHGWNYVQIYDGDQFTLGGATISILRCNEPWGQNNRSATCFVDFGDCSIYLAADISSQVQEYFVDLVDPERMDCDILKAPHHGIDGANSVFLNAITPEAIIITNRTNNGANASWNTRNPYWAGDGMVIMETDGNVWYIWQLPNWLDSEMGT